MLEDKTLDELISSTPPTEPSLVDLDKIDPELRYQRDNREGVLEFIKLRAEREGSKARFEALRHVHEPTKDALDRLRIMIEEEQRIKKQIISDLLIPQTN